MLCEGEAPAGRTSAATALTDRRGPGSGPRASGSFHARPLTVVTRPLPPRPSAAHARTRLVYPRRVLRREPAAPRVMEESARARPGPPKVDGVPWKGQTPPGRRLRGNQYVKPSSDREKAQQSLRSKTSRGLRPRPAVLQAARGVTRDVRHVSRLRRLHWVKARA